MIGAIWAQSLDGIIGDGKTMPWYLPEDLKHFQQVTSQQAAHEHNAPSVLMGKGTWLSLPEKYTPLPNRENHIISTTPKGKWSHGAQVHNELTETMNTMQTLKDHTMWVIGGGQLYAQTINNVDILEVTIIDIRLKNVIGNKSVYAPIIPQHFKLVNDSGWKTSTRGTLLEQYNDTSLLKYKFLTYENSQY